MPVLERQVLLGPQVKSPTLVRAAKLGRVMVLSRAVPIRGKRLKRSRSLFSRRHCGGGQAVSQFACLRRNRASDTGWWRRRWCLGRRRNICFKAALKLGNQKRHGRPFCRVFAHAFADEQGVLQLEPGKLRVRRVECPDILDELGQGAVAVAKQVPLFEDRIVQDAKGKHVCGCSSAVSKRFWGRRAHCQRIVQEIGQGTGLSRLWGTLRQPASRPVVAQHKVVSV